MMNTDVATGPAGTLGEGVPVRARCSDAPVTAAWIAGRTVEYKAVANGPSAISRRQAGSDSDATMQYAG